MIANYSNYLTLNVLYDAIKHFLIFVTLNLLNIKKKENRLSK